MKDDKDDKPRAEKRSHPRRLVLIPVYVGQQQAPAPSLGLIRNVSVAGAYFLTQQRLQEGETLDLSLHLSGDPTGAKRETTATVVRIEELDLDTTDLWFYGVGVTFSEELTDIQSEIEALAKKLAAVE